jgi:hypothetical protein
MLHRTSSPDYRQRLSAHTGKLSALIVAALLFGIAFVAVGGIAKPLLPAAYPASSSAAPSRCPEAERPFVPKTIVIPGVDRHSTVLAMRRDRRNVPGTAPLTDRGKAQFAWDKPDHILPGSRRGNVKLNAHTYPDGSALGNRLLRGLTKGDRIIVHGAKGQRLCYKVTDRFQVSGYRTYRPYFATRGRPQLAIIVCSGVRRGPGNWTHRTIWYASPVTR